MSKQPPDPEISRLAKLAAGGDEQAFNSLFDLFYPRVRAFAARMLSNIAEGEDVARETMARAARTIRNLHDSACFESWLFRIAGNHCRDCLRSRTREERGRAEIANDPPGREQSHDELQAALAALPPEQRAAVLLVYFDGLNHREASRALGCAEPTISWRLMLARRTLKKMLTQS